MAGLRRWLPVAAWAAVIFTFSTGWFTGEHTARVLLPLLAHVLPGVPEASLHAVHAALRKCAHAGEYLVLSLLVARALTATRPWTVRVGLLGVAMAAGWAAADELHQVLVPGRGAALSDVLIDLTGAIGGQALVAFHARRGRAARPTAVPAETAPRVRSGQRA